MQQIDHVNYTTHHVQPDGGSVNSQMQQIDHGTSNVPPLYHDEFGNAYSYNPMQTNSTRQTQGVQSVASPIGTPTTQGAPLSTAPPVAEETPITPGAFFLILLPLIITNANYLYVFFWLSYRFLNLKTFSYQL